MESEIQEIKEQVSTTTNVVVEEKKYISYSSKYTYSDKIILIEPALKSICEIRELGDKKHGVNSWLLTPVESDATFNNNLDALVRHYTLYSLGNVEDESGFNHTGHLLCRCMMLLTRVTNLVTNRQGYINKPIGSESNNFYKYITSALMTSILKMNISYYKLDSTKIDQVHDEIKNLLCTIPIKYKDESNLVKLINKEEFITKINYFDKLFACFVKLRLYSLSKKEDGK